MPDDVKEIKSLEEATVALQELREAFKSRNDDVVSKEKFDKLEKSFTDWDAKQSKLTMEAEAARKEALEAKERAEALEKNADELKKRIEDIELSGPKTEQELKFIQTPEYKAMQEFFKSGHTDSFGAKALQLVEQKTLRTDIATDGGYLVPELMSNELIREIEQISPMRSVARVRTISGKTLQQPVRDSIPAATWEGEAETGGTGQSGYRNETITPYRLTTTVGSTRDQLMDSAFDMVAEITSDVATSFAQTEGIAFLTGDGVKKPTGWLADTRVTANAVETGTAGELSLIDVRALPGEMKLGYNGIYVFNQRTLARLRVEVGTNGQFVWQPAITEAAGMTIDGYRYVIMPDMAGPDAAGVYTTGEFPVGFGDFARGYGIYDRTGLEVVRDEVTAKKQAIIEWTFYRYVTGQVLIPEAIKVLKVK